MKKLEFVIPGIVLIVLVGLILFSSKEKALGAAAGWIDYYTSTTNVAKTTTVGLELSTVSGGYTHTAGIASSTEVLASNTARVFARIQNISKDGYTISCLLGSTATSTKQIGIVLAPIASSTLPSAFELNKDNPYAGAINCFSVSTTTIAVTEN